MASVAVHNTYNKQQVHACMFIDTVHNHVHTWTQYTSIVVNFSHYTWGLQWKQLLHICCGLKVMKIMKIIRCELSRLPRSLNFCANFPGEALEYVFVHVCGCIYICGMYVCCSSLFIVIVVVIVTCVHCLHSS